MRLTSNRKPTLLHADAPSRLRWVAGAMLVVLLASVALVRADDLLGRSVRVDIPAEALSSALIQFSAQTGVQVAAADADVAHLQSPALQGDYTVQTALSRLLFHTGLAFASVGNNTIAIRRAPGAAAVTAVPGSQAGNGAVVSQVLHHTGVSFGSAGNDKTVIPSPAAASFAPGSQAGAGPGTSPVLQSDVNIINTGPAPSEQELAGESVFHFILHHGTTHHTEADSGGPVRWRGGRVATICPVTAGLDQAQNDFVTARILAVARYVGAPVARPGSRCSPNVQVLFTTDPRTPMERVIRRAAATLGFRFPHRIEEQLQISGTHAIQGWYFVAGGGGSVLNRDASMLAGMVALRALWPISIDNSLRDIDRDRGIVDVMLVVDTRRVSGFTIGAISDYLAMVTLTVVQSPDHCDPLPSILDLMSSTCGMRAPPTGLTAADAAFLKAVYYLNTGLLPTPSVRVIELHMRQQLSTR